MEHLRPGDVISMDRDANGKEISFDDPRFTCLPLALVRAYAQEPDAEGKRPLLQADLDDLRRYSVFVTEPDDVRSRRASEAFEHSSRGFNLAAVAEEERKMKVKAFCPFKLTPAFENCGHQICILDPEGGCGIACSMFDAAHLSVQHANNVKRKVAIHIATAIFR